MKIISCMYALPFARTWNCIVNWNEAETSWDCPCHGSRFTYDGKVIEGPAIADLLKRELN